jgi:lipoprotein NlpI
MSHVCIAVLRAVIVHLIAFLVLPQAALAQRLPNEAARSLDRAVTEFLAGRVAESVVEFDRVARLAPDVAPELWQRGIALYYVGRYEDCRDQFESHRTVNPNDVENAAWHFLCVARAESPARARTVLLPVGPDPRRPMREVYQMFRGAMLPRDVIDVAGTDLGAQFYAQLYVGLYYEALGEDARAREHLRVAAEERFARAGGYMHRVARVHLDVRAGR